MSIIVDDADGLEKVVLISDSDRKSIRINRITICGGIGVVQQTVAIASCCYSMKPETAKQ